MKTFRCLLSSAFTSLLLLSVTLFPARAADNHEGSKRDASPAMAAAHAAAKGDVLLESLLSELERSKSELRMDHVQAPYYIEYRVDDVEDFAAEAAFGATREAQHNHVRVLRVVVRLGDYKQDSFYGQGQGEANILPLDNDPLALRHQIWLLTDDAYKEAGQALAEKQAALKQFSADLSPVEDFAHAPVVTDVGSTAELKEDDAAWKKTLEDMTALYRQHPDIQFVSANARFAATNQYLVNSEGTVARHGKETYFVQVSASAQAEDGMRLSRSPAWMTGRLEELPSRDALLKDTRQTLDTLEALRKAPIVEEEYRGPVLFAPDAANDVVTSLIGSNLLGRKPPLGRPNRTVGAFATSYKTRVLPAFLSIVDDPTVKEFQGKSLVGSYTQDSEGVKAQPVVAVDKGVLVNYLVGRQPIRDFAESNGHGRAAPGSQAVPSLGVLIVKSTEQQSPEDLKQRMIQMISDQGLPYGYRVETLGPGNTPRLLYRVYKDGHEQLVRGAVFSELDIRALRSDLIAVGNDPLVNNRTGAVPVTVIAPSLLFDELEVKRADTSKDKLPDYPPPPLEAR
ncbi:MAG TPA: metallopeptidase TldD-related protein [Candidatus Acidoferrum sp.]|nr:metallopeptidase TldD-related protein [Candidatus Acidoferrum sp.]